MDETKALFQKIKGRDKRSFEALSDAYGWKLYSHIRSRTEDREKADRIFSQTFSAFYQDLQHYEGEDPIEAMLFACADRIGSGYKHDEEAATMVGKPPIPLPKVDSSIYEEKKEPLWLKIFYILCIIVLVLGILAAVWVMAWIPRTRTTIQRL